MLAFQEALTQAIELWDKTPVSILDQQAVQTHALLLAMGKYITYRKEKGELESCADGSDFINRLIKDSITPRGRIRGQPARRSLPEFQTTGRSREDDDEGENEAPHEFTRVNQGSDLRFRRLHPIR
jgi:hypothetical protein